ncbi:ankyrin repeat and SOCS box protein 13-like isoform X2 [Ornithodoros turicata]
MTPLHVACNRGDINCVRRLLKHGANVNFSCIDGGTPLCDAAARGSVSCIRLLLDHGALVNPPLCLTTPLHEASFKGSPDCVQLLVDAGAVLNGNDCNLGTPLHIAVLRNHVDCARILLNAGADVNALKIHQAPLHIAATNESEELGCLLLEYGASVYMTNNRGLTPRQLMQRPNGKLYAKILEHERVPLSLKDSCRRRIRAVLGPRRLRQLRDFHSLPTVMLVYVGHGTLKECA